MKWRVHCCEKRDLLPDPIFKDGEILFAEIGNIHSAPCTGYDRNDDQVGIDLNRIDILFLVNTGLFGGNCLARRRRRLARSGRLGLNSQGGSEQNDYRCHDWKAHR